MKTIFTIISVLAISIVLMSGSQETEARSNFTTSEADIATQYSLHPPIEDIVDGTYTVSAKQTITANVLYKLNISKPQYWFKSGFNTISGIDKIVDTTRDGICFEDVYNVRMANIVPNFIFEPSTANEGKFWCYAYLHNGADSSLKGQWAVSFKGTGVQIMDDDFKIYTNNSAAPFNFKDSLITFHYTSTIGGTVWDRALKISFN